MQLCIITPYLAPGWGGGVTTNIKLLVKGLIENGHEVTVLSGKHPQAEFLENSIEGANCELIPDFSCNPCSSHFQESTREVFDKLNKKKLFDIVLSAGPSAYGLLKKKKLKVPVISLLYQFKVIHLFNSFLDVDDLRTLAGYSLKTVPRILRDIFSSELSFYRKCNGIICGAKHISDSISKYYRICPEKIRTIPFWVDNTRFRPDVNLRVSGRKQLGLSDSDFVFLVVSRIQKTKGIVTALRAFSKKFKKMPNAFLVIAGGGNEDLLDSYKSLAKRLDIDRRTIFTGMVPEEALPSIYNIADVFIMPSRLIEVLPYTILEAIATRLPVIAIKRPGNYEALRDHGAYFADNDDRDLSNIMLQFYANPDLRQDSAQKNFEHFQENFTPEKLINKYMDFIKEIKDKVQVK